MKPTSFQFTTRTLLLATAFIAISLGGTLAALSIIDPPGGLLRMLPVIAGLSPFWMPVPFATYAFGRSYLTAATVVAFALTEAGALGLMWFIDSRS